MTELSLTIQEKNELKKQLPEQLSQAQLVFISQKTPAVFIKQRAGRGGQTFNYVEVGYIMKMLNSIFGFGGWDWEYTLVESLSFPHTKQIVVTGKLTVKIFRDETLITTITKTASGGKDIAVPKGGGDPIDLGDDVKSASADALKKAASMLGMAEDVYAPNIYKAQEAINRSRGQQGSTPMSQEDISENVEKAMDAPDPDERKSLQRGIFAAARDLASMGKLKPWLGVDDAVRKQAIKDFLAQYAIKIVSFSKDPIEDLRMAFEQLERVKNGE